ncbi:DUF721 domain-containing protein [Actinacidiphila sp. DG2A-62]|uniref:DUF721 domain-containing protein n=1 Tax=Actinacidiphila sp. DG2A-62 TaxID=3108821 RepID=UPI002DBB2C51|nr:DUF721 domain-containing protein [Actinacidiphila sp. DG2A-62]MEC3992041.1 DUF721 domain-containing protein [Actinacidiphila sp. DG2A-62]
MTTTTGVATTEPSLPAGPPAGPPAEEAGAASGADLARRALQAARLAAKNRGAAPAKPGGARVRKRTPRGDGREPLSFAAALAALMESRGWQAPAAGGTLADRWPDIAPELAGHVRIGRFDAPTGALDLVPSSPAYATQLRLHSGTLIKRINTALHDPSQRQQGDRQSGPVHSLRILAPGSGQNLPDPRAAAPAGQPPEAGPVRTREDASGGYRQALAAHQAAKAEQNDRLAPAVRAAIERQDQALRNGREPEGAFRDGQAALEELRARAARQTSPDHTRARALQRLAAERAGRVSAVPAAADVRRTA